MSKKLNLCNVLVVNIYDNVTIIKTRNCFFKVSPINIRRKKGKQIAIPLFQLLINILGQTRSSMKKILNESQGK